MAYRSLREIKLCLVGDGGVGKSCLVLRFVSDQFDLHTTATIGASFMSKTFNVGDKAFKYQIWDTAGQEKYKALAPMYYRGAAAAIVVYDLTKKSTFEKAKLWVKELKLYGPSNIVISIAGNKSDLKDQREVSLETGLEYAESIDAAFAEVSALTSDNVNYLFEDISRRLPAENQGFSSGGLKPLVKIPPKKHSKCC
ncbi:ras-related protein Rab-22A-like [Hydractinia symbiolongicarpus]|uniref:ras-related protein Rab-22A-like n=1 Tax=Hydractinia symbiolongicarpus TaxID=13093 RepID=UPI0025509245|nr:ras-related protein Rab-22A-like [Hydractinia symbiolongicarpus]XP_057310347.1 ras-related protein Rab-22A-like [Hydractinia symbiolongicarpus]